MSKGVKKISAVLMGVFSIVSLVKNETVIPNPVVSDNVESAFAEERDFGDKEGMILLSLDCTE